MKFYWYTAKERLNADKVAGGLYGYEVEPPYEIIEKYDLKFVAYETFDELTERYF